MAKIHPRRLLDQKGLMPWTVKTQDYQALDGDRIIADGSITITLPTADAGKDIWIMRKSGTITLATGGQKIDGLTIVVSATITSLWDIVHLVSAGVGSGWSSGLKVTVT